MIIICKMIFCELPISFESQWEVEFSFMHDIWEILIMSCLVWLSESCVMKEINKGENSWGW